MRSREIEREWGDGTPTWERARAKARMLKDFPWLHDCFRQRPDPAKGLAIAHKLVPFIGISTLNYMGGLSGSRHGEIKWNICEGYGSLLHEVAHQMLGHCGPGRIESKMQREYDAWLLSEQLCKEYGLRFNYHVAQSFYLTYAQNVIEQHVPSLESAWKWKPKRRASG